MKHTSIPYGTVHGTAEYKYTFFCEHHISRTLDEVDAPGPQSTIHSYPPASQTADLHSDHSVPPVLVSVWFSVVSNCSRAVPHELNQIIEGPLFVTYSYNIAIAGLLRASTRYPIQQTATSNQQPAIGIDNVVPRLSKALAQSY